MRRSQLRAAVVVSRIVAQACKAADEYCISLRQSNLFLPNGSAIQIVSANRALDAKNDNRRGQLSKKSRGLRRASATVTTTARRGHNKRTKPRKKTDALLAIGYTYSICSSAPDLDRSCGGSDYNVNSVCMSEHSSFRLLNRQIPQSVFE